MRENLIKAEKKSHSIIEEYIFFCVLVCSMYVPENGLQFNMLSSTSIIEYFPLFKL